MPPTLSQRLQALADTFKPVQARIQELNNFSPDPTNSDDPDEQRQELELEIQNTLREQQDTLELLALDVEDEGILQESEDFQSERSDRDNEHERNAVLLARLTEDLKSTRTAYRTTLLRVKKQAQANKLKKQEEVEDEIETPAQENESQPKPKPKTKPKNEILTQDDLALRSAEDVTQALRRVHAQLEGELQQSQFAQQTLNESQEALRGLSESYAGTTDLLKASRSLVGQLVSSNKSDSWYLLSAWYLLAGTLAWLVYRRILYGPSMLLIYYPFRLLWFILSSVGTIILGTPASELQAPPKPTLSVVMPGMASVGVSTGREAVPVASSGYPVGDSDIDEREGLGYEGESLVEKIGRLTDSAGSHQTGETEARNTKKRMMEVDVDGPSSQSRDEL